MSRNIEKWMLNKPIIPNEYMGYTWPGKVLLEPYHRDRVYLKLNGCLLEFREHDSNPDKYCITVGDGIIKPLKMVVLKEWIYPKKQAYKICKRRLKEKINNRSTWMYSGISFFKCYNFCRSKGIDLSEELCESILKELDRRKKFYADLSTTRDTGRGFRKTDWGRTCYS